MSSKIKSIQTDILTTNELRATKNKECQETAKKSLANLVIEDERDIRKVETESSEFNTSRFKDDASEELLQPRMYSIKQLRELFFIFLHTSKFREDVQKLKKNYDDFSSTVTEYHLQNDTLLKKQYTRTSDLESKIVSFKKQ